MESVYLRPPRRDEMSFIQVLWGDPETMAPVGGPILLTDEQAARWFKAMIQPGRPTDYYCLIFKARDRPVGEISYHGLDETMTAEFNLKIASAERGHGYAPIAMRLFLDTFFNQRGGQRLVDEVAIANHRGQQVLLQFGFEHDARHRDGVLLTMTREQFNRLYPRPEGLPPRAR